MSVIPQRLVRVAPWPVWTENPYLARLSTELRQRNIDVLTPQGVLDFARLRAGDWLHLHWPGGPQISKARALYRLRLRRFMWLVRASRRRGIRLAWTAHNLLPHDDPHPDLALQLRRELMPHLEHVFVHFPSASATLASELGYRGPTTVIPHGSYVDDYGPLRDGAKARARLGLPPEGFVALLLGGLRPYKGVADAVEAFAAMAKPNDRLVIAGKVRGDMERELSLARKAPGVVVREGRVPALDIADYHAAASCVVAAHRASFTSGSAVMALSLGCPVVGVYRHHLEALGPEPRVFGTEPGLAGLAAGLRRARDARVDRSEIRAWAEHHLSWSTAGERTAEVLRAPQVAS